MAPHKNVKEKTAPQHGMHRLKAAEKLKADRKSKRIEALCLRRNIQETPVSDDINDKKKALQRWKQEKERMKKLMKDKQKPAFKVGIVKHRLNSPISIPLPKSVQKRKGTGTSARKKQEDNHYNFAPENFQFKAPKGVKAIHFAPTSVEKTRAPYVVKAAGYDVIQGNIGLNKRVTRSQVKQFGETDTTSFKMQNDPYTKSAQKVHSANARIVKIIKTPAKLNAITAAEKTVKATPQTPLAQVLTTPAKLNAITAVEKTIKATPQTPLAQVLTTTVTVNRKSFKKVPLNDDNVERTINTKDDTSEAEIDSEKKFPASFSPFITSVRGKRSSASYTRHEASLKGIPLIGVCKSEPFTPTRDKRNSTCPVAQTDVSQFRTNLNNEVYGLRKLCDHWLEIQATTEDLPDHVSEAIDVVVGMSKLLMKEKLAQFEELVSDCEFSRGEKKVTESDLQGFWDMVYLQITDVHKRFQNLTECQSNGWQEKEVVKNMRKKVITKKKRNSKGRGKATQSNLRAIIAAARKKQKEAEAAECDSANDVHVVLNNSVKKNTNYGTPKQKPTSTPLKQFNSSTPKSLKKQKRSTEQFFTPDSAVSSARKSSRKSMPLAVIDFNLQPKKGILKSAGTNDSIVDETANALKGRRKSLRSAVKFESENLDTPVKQKYPATPIRGALKSEQLELSLPEDGFSEGNMDASEVVVDSQIAAPQNVRKSARRNSVVA